MYEDLVNRLREPCQYENCVLCKDAADAIEERDKYALSLQHEMMAEAESHIEAMGRLNKQIDYLQEQVAYWQAKLVESMCGESLLESEKPHWVSVAERFPEEGETIGDATFSVDVLGFDGWNYRRAYYNYTAKVWLNGNDEQEWPEITHWMPLTPAPESAEEETT